MAIPFEAAPATVFKESDIAEFGLALQDRQEAKETQKRERFEKAYKETNLPAWTQRDTAVMKYASAVRDLLLDPAIYNAKTGSPEHIRGLRAKEQLERVAAASGANKKRFEEEEDFLRNNPDAEGVNELMAYHDMPFDGEVVIDEYGNGLVNGEPIITHPALSTPPSLRKREKGVNLEDVWGGTTMGQYTTPDGIVAVPSRGEARAFIERKFGGMPDKDKYLKSYIEGKYLQEYGMMPARGYAESIISDAPDELMESFIDEMTKQHLELYKSGGKQSSEGGGGAFGVDNSKVTVTPLPVGQLSMKIKVGEGDAAVDKTVKSELYGFSTKPITWVGDESKDKGVSYFVDAVQFDEAGNMIVSGYKSVGSIEAAVMGIVRGEIEAGGDVMEVLSRYGIKTEPLTQKKLSESEASSFSSSLKDKHKALAPLKTVAQIRDWTADYVGYSPKSKETQTDGGQSSGDGLNASEIKQQKQNTEEESSGLNASKRKGK